MFTDTPKLQPISASKPHDKKVPSNSSHQNGNNNNRTEAGCSRTANDANSNGQKKE